MEFPLCHGDRNLCAILDSQGFEAREAAEDQAAAWPASASALSLPGIPAWLTAIADLPSRSRCDTEYTVWSSTIENLPGVT